MPAGAAQDSGRTRILGIDPGTRVLGYGLVEIAAGGRNSPGWSYVECGVIKAPTELEIPARLIAICGELTEVFAELSPRAVALEKAFVGQSVSSALKLGQVRGAVMLLAGQHEVPVFEYGPTVVKRAVAGHGRASKQDVALRVQMLLGMRRVPREDAADALAIAMCHANYVSFPGGPQSPGQGSART